jgi:hypothetical protein
MGAASLVVLDTAIATEAGVLDAELIARYRADFRSLQTLAVGPSWLVLQKPIRAVRAVEGKTATGGNSTLTPTSAEGLPASVELLPAYCPKDKPFRRYQATEGDQTPF